MQVYNTYNYMRLLLSRQLGHINDPRILVAHHEPIGHGIGLHAVVHEHSSILLRAYYT